MSRAKKQSSFQSETLVSTRPEPASFTTNSGIRKAVKLIPRNLHQEEYLEYLLDHQKIIILAHGPAGTGKSVMAMMAGIKALSEKRVHKLILCRPAVAVDGEDHGFLPGDINEKLEPWTKPLFDVIREYYGSKDIQNMLESGIIEMAPLMYMRGRNLKDCFVILDEAQNASIAQCKALLTRICDNTKIVITGDNDQSDRKSNENGLLFFKNAVQSFGGSKYIASVEFDFRDIERHEVVKDVLKIFEKAGK